MEDAYAAGLFDGEGTVGIYAVGNSQPKNKGRWWSVKLAIAGAHKPMIEAIAGHMRVGSFTTQKRQSLQVTPSGRVYGDGGRLCKQGWRWFVTSRSEVRQVLVRLMPYLIEKRAQAQLVLDFIDGKLDGAAAAKQCKRAKRLTFSARRWKGPLRRNGGLRGANNPMSKLSDEQVLELRRRYAKGERSLAAGYGFTNEVSVWRAATKRTYKWVV